MEAVTFGLASAFCWGAADFTGGLMSRRTNLYGVIVTSQGIGAILLLLLALALGEPLPSPSILLWSAAAGLVGVLGLIALYRALASGRMGIAAPLSAVITAAIPVLVGVFLEGSPTALQGLGFGLALLAVFLISRPQAASLSQDNLALPLFAGLCFGLFFVALNRLSHVAVLWPLVGARFASAIAMLLFSLLTQRDWLPDGKTLPLIFLNGVLDMAGNTFFVLASRVGRMDVASVLSSLYPAATVWLAWLILKERFTRIQVFGIATALTAIAMITA